MNCDDDIEDDIIKNGGQVVCWHLPLILVYDWVRSRDEDSSG